MKFSKIFAPNWQTTRLYRNDYNHRDSIGYPTRLNTIWLEIRDSRFRIEDSRFKKKSVKMPSKRKHQVLENQSMCPQYSYYKAFIPIIKLSNAGPFHKNSQSVACCTFGMLEIRTLTQNRFKNQSSDTVNMLDHNCNHI